jgi:hypothetical protein
MACVTHSIPARPNNAMLNSTLPTRLAEVTAASPFAWKDFSRFVEVGPVDRGWLVLWGTFRDSGRTRELAGSQTYKDLAGARRRVGDAVFELTRNPVLVAEAMLRFDRTSFPTHAPDPLPDPL